MFLEDDVILSVDALVVASALIRTQRSLARSCRTPTASMWGIGLSDYGYSVVSKDHNNALYLARLHWGHNSLAYTWTREAWTQVRHMVLRRPQPLQWAVSRVRWRVVFQGEGWDSNDH